MKINSKKIDREICNEGYQIISRFIGGVHSRVYLCSREEEVIIKYPEPDRTEALDGSEPVWVNLSEKFYHVQNEANILERIGQTEGIPQLKKMFYFKTGKEFIPIIVKEYIEEMPENGKEFGIFRRTKDKLFNLVLRLHDLGFASLDISKQNIIVNNQNTPYLIDLGTLIFCGKDLSRFKQFKKEDFTKLEKLLS